MTSSQTFPTTTTPLSGRTGTIAVTLLFLVNGMLLGGYAGALPSLRDKLGIDANSIAVLLFCAGAAAIASMQIGGRLADAIGARTVTLVALPLLIAGASVTALATTFQVALVGVVLIGLGNGSLDVAMNAIGVQVEAARRRPIMSFFHAMWSVGNFIGAATVLLLATALGMTGGSIVTPLLITLSVIATLALGVLIKITPVAAVVEHKVGGVRTAIPRAAWILGIMALGFGLSEGTATDWSAIHVTDVAQVDSTTGSLGLVAVSGSMVAIRLIGDRLVSRFGRRAVVRFGGACAAVGYLAVSVRNRSAVVAGRLGAGRIRRRDDRSAGVRGGRAPWRRPSAGRGGHLRVRSLPDGAGRDRVPGRPGRHPTGHDRSCPALRGDRHARPHDAEAGHRPPSPLNQMGIG